MLRAILQTGKRCIWIDLVLPYFQENMQSQTRLQLPQCHVDVFHVCKTHRFNAAPATTKNRYPDSGIWIQRTDHMAFITGINIVDRNKIPKR